MHVVRVRCENPNPSALGSLLYSFVYMWTDDKLQGSFLSGWTMCVLVGGGQGRGGAHQEEPLESKYDANSNGVRSVLRASWEGTGRSEDRVAAPPFLARPGAEVFHGVLVSLSSPLSLPVLGAFFLKN